jgi:hypothetical protein
MLHIKLLEDWSTPYSKELEGIKPDDIDIDVFLTQGRKYIKLGKTDALGHLVALFSRKTKDAKISDRSDMISALSAIMSEAENEGIVIPGFGDSASNSDSTKGARKDYDRATKAMDLIRVKDEINTNVVSMIAKLMKDVDNEMNKIKPMIGGDYGGELGKYYNSIYDRIISYVTKSRYGTRK